MSVDDARTSFVAARTALNEAIERGSAEEKAAKADILRAAESKFLEALVQEKIMRGDDPADNEKYAALFDFNNVKFLDPNLSREADVYAQDALAAISSDGERPSRWALIAALRAMCLLTRDALAIHAEQLCKPVKILIKELVEADAGRKDGNFVFLEHSRTWDTRIDSIEEIERQGRAVIAYGWLKMVGLRPQEAATQLDAVLDVGSDRIQDWPNYFRRKTPKNRRPRVLGNLWWELEDNWRWPDGAQRTLESATVSEIMEWVRWHRENGTIVTKATAKPRRMRDHARD